MKRSDIEVAIESHCNICLGFCLNSSECETRSCSLWEVRTTDMCRDFNIEFIHDSIDNYCVTCSTHECSGCHLNLDV